jgi:hypothetical protein
MWHYKKKIYLTQMFDLDGNASFTSHKKENNTAEARG